MTTQTIERNFAYNIYRLALPQHASLVQRRNFQKQIEVIRQVNPGWAVVSDWAMPGEREAYVMIHKDKDYTYRRVLHLAKSHLSRTIAGDYSDDR